MLAYARLRPGPGFKPLHAAFYYAQRTLVQPRLRSAITARIAAAINRRHPPNGVEEDTIWQTRDCSAVVQSLESDGIAILPERLTKVVEEINHFLSDKPMQMRNGELVLRERVPSDCTIANYPLETVLSCPHVLALANSSFLIRTATQYLGCLPTIATIGIRWSFPGTRREAYTQNFHRDRDDWRFVKFFVYLTDVDESSGPHHFLRGSHRSPLELFSRPYNVENLENAFGRNSICVVTGPAGTAFLADTIGVHAGPIPTGKPRLMLTVGYNLLPLYSLLYKPVEIEPRPPVDRYINRLIVA